MKRTPIKKEKLRANYSVEELDEAEKIDMQLRFAIQSRMLELKKLNEELEANGKDRKQSKRSKKVKKIGPLKLIAAAVAPLTSAAISLSALPSSSSASGVSIPVSASALASPSSTSVISTALIPVAVSAEDESSLQQFIDDITASPSHAATPLVATGTGNQRRTRCIAKAFKVGSVVVALTLQGFFGVRGFVKGDETNHEGDFYLLLA